MSAEKLLNRELEEKLLGEIAANSTLDTEETRVVVERMALSPEVFGHEDTRLIFELMRSRLDDGEPCSAIGLDQELKKRGKKNPLIQMQGQASGMPLVFCSRWALELKELRARRQLREVAKDLLYRAEDSARPVDESIAYLGQQMNLLVSGGASRIQTLDAKLPVVAAQMDAVGAGQSTVVRCGIDVWDRNVGGLWPTLNVIGGHPSRGKSALAASMILGLARQGIPGIIFSMEDPAEWLLYRYIAHLSRVPGFLMRTRPLDGKQQESVGNVWGDVRELSKFIMFDERGRLKPAQLVSAAREAILTRGAKWVFADHAGEFAFEKQRDGNRHDLDIAEGLSEMREIGKAMNVPFILLSQLSRGAKIPHSLQDFKNASAIEETARVAAIVWTNDGSPLDVNVSCVKNTFGKRDFDMKFQLDATSGLLIEPPNPTMPAGEQGALL